MTDEVNHPAVYLEETQPAKPIDGVATIDRGERLEELPPAMSIPGVPTIPCPQPSGSLPAETYVSRERSETPVHPFEQTDG